ncbi:MAG: metallophosphoesterase, partial [Myxococcota bacterium]|nr:metallophosphoesterase [Myxococcota bacterium]
MKIIQITDVHRGSVGEKTHGIDVRAQFEAVLNHAIQNGGERIVLTGDLCFQHPQRDIYSWIHQRLDSLSIPFTVISGNHDDSQLLCNEFYPKERYNEESGELYWMENWKQIPVLFLDTAK